MKAVRYDLSEHSENIYVMLTNTERQRIISLLSNENNLAVVLRGSFEVLDNKTSSVVESGKCHMTLAVME